MISILNHCILLALLLLACFVYISIFYDFVRTVIKWWRNRGKPKDKLHKVNVLNDNESVADISWHCKQCRHVNRIKLVVEGFMSLPALAQRCCTSLPCKECNHVGGWLLVIKYLSGY